MKMCLQTNVKFVFMYANSFQHVLCRHPLFERTFRKLFGRKCCTLFHHPHEIMFNLLQGSLAHRNKRRLILVTLLAFTTILVVQFALPAVRNQTPEETIVKESNASPPSTQEHNSDNSLSANQTCRIITYVAQLIQTCC